MRLLFTRPTTRAFFGLLFLLLSPVAVSATALRVVAPGEPPGLQPGEGLLLVAFDSDGSEPHLALHLSGEKTPASFDDIPDGRSRRLVVVPAGPHHWSRAQFGDDAAIVLPRNQFAINVAPGTVTYAGEIVLRQHRDDGERAVMVNRALAALDFLYEKHETIAQGHAFRYAGNAPDSFPEFYKQKIAPKPSAGTRSRRPTSTKTPLPYDIPSLWEPGRIAKARINPAGTLGAIQDDADGSITFVDLRSGARIAQSSTRDAIDSIEWTDDDTLLVAEGYGQAPRRLHLLNVRADDATGALQRIDVAQRGWVVDSLRDDPDHILLATQAHGGLMVHRMEISSQRAVDRFRPTARTRLNRGADGDVAWYTDGVGNLRLALVRRDEGYVLVRAHNGRYDDVLSFSGKDAFDPYGTSYDASELYGITERERGQRELVVFDVASRRVSRTLFSRPGVDVEAPIFDSRRNAIGVSYYRHGVLQSEYFDAGDRRLDAALRAAFPARTATVMDRSSDGRQLLVSVEAADHPAQIYHYDAIAQKAQWIADSLPHLAHEDFAPAQVISFRGHDGMMVEGFLTQPLNAVRPPLIVMPHGGPIGVADRLQFNPEVQFLAGLGYAVLRVNFRGSDGYGKAFREAGHRNYGTGIEDDVMAAVDHVAETYPVDAERLCFVGTSYGGFSALTAAARWPDRLRCAVSVSGVSDLGLMFTASDTGRTDAGRSILERIVGDPVAQQAELRRASPLYSADRIRVPVLLAHGREDVRVDYEHTARMQRMLRLSGNPAELLVFKDEGHGVDRNENLVKLWTAIANFLGENLPAQRRAPASGALVAMAAATPGR